MRQHSAAKSAHPDCVIFFRLGDFYEMFGDDAVLVSEVLDLTLTSRNKGKADEIPMAGIPHHAAHGYIARMLKAGHKVAICEQMADPSTVKGIVPREVVRVITPGTWTEESQLPDGANNWLCAVEIEDGEVGIALLDLSTAELMAASLPDFASCLSELGRAGPREILLGPGAAESGVAGVLGELLREPHIRVGDPVSDREAKRALMGLEMGKVAALAARAAARALLFARDCYRGRTFPVWRVAVWNPSGILGLDQAAQRHLELVESTVGDKKATLLHVLDRTGSPGGARLLRRRLLAPLTDVAQIASRLDAVSVLVDNPQVRGELRRAMGQVGDLERLAVRGSVGETTPRDLGNVRKGLVAGAEVFALLKQLPSAKSQRLFGADAEVDLVLDLRGELERALVERPPALAKEGAIFREGFDQELDELGVLRVSGSERLAALEAELKTRTGISNLRVKYTRVFGWYAEVSRTHSSKVPKDWRRKQTVANGERYTFSELDDLAEEIQSAESRFRSRELALLGELQELLKGAAQRVHQLTSLLSSADVSASLAEVAADLDYCRPDVDSSDTLEIVDGRHPVVERLAAAGRFVPNDAKLTVRKEHLWLVSGPNMAGKSTFLRQVALIAILAQMGSFVPAKKAKIGLVDRVLSRVGASDNLAGGESTFMVEMRETANILRTATSRSLVILDEVGRGTSTFDGLAIAWAVAEHLDQVIQCRSLFATHYHELTALAEASTTAENYCVSAREKDGEVIFLHRVGQGAASRSYGVAVAQLAGLPEAVLSRARSVLKTLEEGGAAQGRIESKAAGPQVGLFEKNEQSVLADEVIDQLKELDPDRMTGIEALQLLHQLTARLKS